jgi:peptidoglycan/LPS O-acetylase OafA/YrhL
MATHYQNQDRLRHVTIATPRLDALTGARGIAALLVVFYHIRDSFTDAVPTALIAVFAKGYLAVDLFFVLSGFVMWLNYSARFAADGWRAAPDFLVRRMARIYPLHFAILTAMVMFAGIAALAGRPLMIDSSISDLPLNYLLMQNWGLTNHLTWNDPAWSISTEFGAYLLMPGIAILFTRRAVPVSILLLLIAALCAVLHSFMAVQGAATIGHGIVHNGLVRCVTEFIIGNIICLIWQRATPVQHQMLQMGAFALMPVFTLTWGDQVFAIPAICAALVYLLAQTSAWRGNPLTTKPLLWLGEVSYSVYLAHFFAWFLFKIAFVNDLHNVAAPVMLSFVALVLLLSAVLHAIIEKPGRTWVQALAARITSIRRSRIEEPGTQG